MDKIKHFYGVDISKSFFDVETIQQAENDFNICKSVLNKLEVIFDNAYAQWDETGTNGNAFIFKDFDKNFEPKYYHRISKEVPKPAPTPRPKPPTSPPDRDGPGRPW